MQLDRILGREMWSSEPATGGDDIAGIPVDPGTGGNWQNPSGDREGGEGNSGFAEWGGVQTEGLAEMAERKAKERHARTGKSEEPPQKKAAKPPAGEGEPEKKPSDLLADADSEETANGETEEPDDDSAAPEDEESDEDAIRDLLGNIGQERLATTKSPLRVERIQSLKDATQIASTQKELDQIQQRIDRDYEYVDGSYRIRPEIAAEALRAAQPPVSAYDERQIELEVVRDMRKFFLETLKIEKEDLHDALDRSKEEIQRRVEQRKEALEGEYRAHLGTQRTRANAILHSYFESHPEHKAVQKQVVAWYMRFPENVRSAVVLNGFVPVDAIAELEYQKAKLEGWITDAFKKGKKVGRKGQQAPTRGAQVGAGKSGVGRGQNGQAGSAAAQKQAILGAQRKGVMDQF
jgi:hypothetical protein